MPWLVVRSAEGYTKATEGHSVQADHTLRLEAAAGEAAGHRP
jgi:hypothetical protein